MSSSSDTTPSTKEPRGHIARILAAFGVLILLGSAPSCDCEGQVRKVVDKSPDERRIDKVAAEPVVFEREPNNAPEEANAIVLGKELRPFTAKVDGPSDVDWFEIVTRDDGALYTVEVRPTEGLDVSLHLQIPGHEGLPITYNIGGPGEPESVVSMKLSKEPRRMAVRGESGQGGYELVFERRMAGGNVEWEPNDVPSAAVELEVPGEIEGFVDRPDDRDIYVMRPARDTEPAGPLVLKFDFKPVMNLPQVIRFYSDAKLQQELLSLQVAGQTGQSTTIPNFRMPPEVEELWLVLTAPSGYDRKSAYRVSFQRLPEAAEDLELEPNDKLTQPLSVPSSIRGIFHSASDVDRFGVGINPKEDTQTPDAGTIPTRIDAGTADAGVDAGDASVADMGADQGIALAPLVLPEKVRMGDLLVVRAKPSRSGVKIGATLSGPDGDRRIEADRSGAVSICDTIYHPGELEFWVHAVEVDESRALGIDYTVDFSDTSGLEGFEIEPNDSKDTADTLDGARTAFLPQGDVDTWAFKVEGQDGSFERVTLNLEGKHPMSVQVLDSDGAAVSAAAAATTHAIGVDLPRGIYFVVVEPEKTGAFCDAYRIKLGASEGQKQAYPTKPPK